MPAMTGKSTRGAGDHANGYIQRAKADGRPIYSAISTFHWWDVGDERGPSHSSAQDLLGTRLMSNMVRYQLNGFTLCASSTDRLASAGVLKLMPWSGVLVGWLVPVCGYRVSRHAQKCTLLT